MTALLALVAVFVFVLSIVGLVMRHERREVKAKRGQPICGCNHHKAMHDPETGRCHGEIYRSGNGTYASCGCRQYIGPEPLPSYYAPEIEQGD